MGVEHLMRADQGSCPKEFQLDPNHPMVVNLNNLAELLDACILELKTEMSLDLPRQENIKVIQDRMDSIIATIDKYRFARLNIEILKNIKFPCLDCRDIGKHGQQ